MTENEKTLFLLACKFCKYARSNFTTIKQNNDDIVKYVADKSKISLSPEQLISLSQELTIEEL